MKFSEINSKSNQKFVREKIRKYDLTSQRKIPYFEAEKLLSENGFVLNNKNKNCLFINSGNEGMKHWLIKAIIFKILRERGRNVGTEVEVNSGIIDILDADNLIAYEIETNLTKKKIREKIRNYSLVKDIFIIDTKEISDDLEEAENFLREKIV